MCLEWIVIQLTPEISPEVFAAGTLQLQELAAARSYIPLRASAHRRGNDGMQQLSRARASPSIP